MTNVSRLPKDEDVIKVRYTHPNRGEHAVHGPATGRYYGQYGGGAIFLVLKRDVFDEYGRKVAAYFDPVEGKAELPQIATRAAPPPPPPSRISQVQALAEAAQDPIPEADPVPEVDIMRLVAEDRPSAPTVASLRAIVSEKIAAALEADGYTTLSSLATLGMDGLQSYSGIGPARAEAIMAAIG